jgi:hypothetical protein
MLGWASLVNTADSKSKQLVNSYQKNVLAIEAIAAKLDRVEKKLQHLERTEAAIASKKDDD